MNLLGTFKSCVKLFWPFYDPPIPFPCCHALGVVYFDQCLDAAHLKHWSKYAFSHLLHEKYRKRNEKKVKKIKITLGQCLGASLKTTFLLHFSFFLILFSRFHDKILKSVIQPMFGVNSTQSLVKIYNTYALCSGYIKST